MSTMTFTPNPIRLIATTGVVPVNAGVCLPALAEPIDHYHCRVRPVEIHQSSTSSSFKRPTQYCLFPLPPHGKTIQYP